MKTDPVCGMTVDPEQAAACVEYRGATYYFCSHACHQTFTATPEAYVKRGGEKTPPDKPGHKHG